MTEQWYVLRVVSGFESKVRDSIKEALQSDSSLSSDLKTIDLFSESKPMVRFGKKVDVEVSMMPGYLMIRMSSSPELVNLIRRRRHVLGFLGSNGDTPEPVSEEEIAKLRATVAKVADDGALVFAVGENVRIIDGPFASFSGLVDEVEERKRKLKVAVAILGRKIPVVLEYSQVEKQDDQ